LEQLLLRRGAAVLRVPLITILDAPDQAPVIAWLKRFVEEPPHIFVILTGEGLRRLRALAEREGLAEAFGVALGQVLKVCRGPKPGRALHEMGLKPDVLGKAPTSAGVIESLEELALEGQSVAVQLYGEEPNLILINYLRARGACLSVVAPYVYAPDSDVEHVLALIGDMALGKVTMIAFTSQPQFTRLLEVARRHEVTEALFSGLARVKVAAVGPIVAKQLQDAGVTVSVMPESQFFMKPMVTELMRLCE
jgi:uroporphyrinogen-III synthase